MRLNGGLISAGTSEYVKLRKAWKARNAKCHPDAQIDWEGYFNKHKK